VLQHGEPHPSPLPTNSAPLHQHPRTQPQVLRLWEALWTRHPSPFLKLYVCLGVLMRNRTAILAAPDFDALLALCLGLSGTLDVGTALADAEMLCRHAGEAGAACLEGLQL
jgi:hypothetical protein